MIKVKIPKNIRYEVSKNVFQLIISIQKDILTSIEQLILLQLLNNIIRISQQLLQIL